MSEVSDILEKAEKLLSNKSGIPAKDLTLEEAGQMLRGNPLHAWYSTEHMLKSGDAVYEDLNGKPVAVTLVCWSKERGEDWIKRTKYTDYQYIGPITSKFIGNLGATEIFV
jgi:hypothetical protein